jgi:hypothetical protein
VTSSKSNLNVLFVLFGIWWIDFGVLSSDKSIEQIIRKNFSFIKRVFHILIELFGEIITVIDPENTLEDIEID